jgi:hypothetical protein
MFTTIMKYIAILTLLATMFWEMTPNLQSYPDFIIATAAVFVLVQAVSLRKYWWMAAFVTILLLFNPIRSVELPFRTMIALQILTAALFAVSLHMLKSHPRMTTASITEARPKTEPL